MPCPKERTRVLFVYTNLSSFVRRDLEILQKHFNVKKMNATTFLVPRRGRDRLVFFKLMRGILWADIAYSWFADLNAFFIVLFCMFLGKKSMIVVGGYDVVYVPEIDYGELNSWWGRVRAKFVLEHATKILPFSYYAKDRVLRITKKSNVYVVLLGCDTRKFMPHHGKKEDLVTTVCYIEKSNIKRKGLKTFIESARFLPDVRFVLIGPRGDDSINYLRKISSPNVEFTGYVSDEELLEWYQKTKVYCQLSYEEGFGVALVEAMACECIPVVSLKAKVLRETVGNFGFYVPYGDVKTTVEAIQKALCAPQEIGAKARKNVKVLLSIEKREKELLRLIDEIMYAHK